MEVANKSDGNVKTPIKYDGIAQAIDLTKISLIATFASTPSSSLKCGPQLPQIFPFLSG